MTFKPCGGRLLEWIKGGYGECNYKCLEYQLTKASRIVEFSGCVEHRVLIV